MAKILYITANPKTTATSFSLATGDAFIKQYAQVNPNDEIVHIDLFKTEVPLIDADVFNGWEKLGQGSALTDLSADEQAKVTRLAAINEEFITADKYVFVTPFWNFSYPPVMKAYIDAVSIAGKAFKYTADGVPVGLLTDKKAVHIQARGGYYTEGPLTELELGNRYIKTIMNFFGVPSFEEVIVEGHNKDIDKAEQIKADAIAHAIEVAKTF